MSDKVLILSLISPIYHHPSLSLISSLLREDFCALSWGDDSILLIGGYDDMGSQRRTELYNVTSGTWKMLANMPGQGRGVHSCSHWMGGVVVAGGWTLAEDEISYDISNNVNW